LAEQAKVLVAEAEENNLGAKAWNERWDRWQTCSLCEQWHHGVVKCALGWACWKTYVGQPETDDGRRSAMTQLGTGLDAANHYEDALSVRQAELAMERRVGADKESLLLTLGNLANSYKRLGLTTEAANMYRDVYSGRLKLLGEEHRETLVVAGNYATSLIDVHRYAESKHLMRKSIPVARRVLGEGHELTLGMRRNYAQTLCTDPSATLDDLREAVATLEDVERIARRVLGGPHPITVEIEQALRCGARVALRARESPPTGDA